MIFRFSSLVSPSLGWEVFHRLIFCPVFLFSFPIIGLGGFLLATWPFETHQLPYKARIFLVVLRFSILISLIGLGGFLPGSHSFLQQFPRSVELASKERGNCNNMTLGIGAKSSQSGSHVTTIIQDFTLVTFDPHHNASPSRAPIWSHGSVSSYVLNHLYLNLYCLQSWKAFPAVRTICISSTCSGMKFIILQSVTGWHGVELLVRCN